MPELTRRTFLKLSAAGTGAAGLTALGFDTASAVQVTQNFRIAGARESLEKESADLSQQVS